MAGPLSIGGKYYEDIGRADFMTLGAGCGIPQKAVARVLDELLAATPSWLDALANCRSTPARFTSWGRRAAIWFGVSAADVD